MYNVLDDTIMPKPEQVLYLTTATCFCTEEVVNWQKGKKKGDNEASQTNTTATAMVLISQEAQKLLVSIHM